jgi:hypothetical protein
VIDKREEKVMLFFLILEEHRRKREDCEEEIRLGEYSSEEDSVACEATIAFPGKASAFAGPEEQRDWLRLQVLLNWNALSSIFTVRRRGDEKRKAG